jgi:ABC-type Fe3+ transport system substrate-binding protein
MSANRFGGLVNRLIAVVDRLTDEDSRPNVVLLIGRLDAFRARLTCKGAVVKSRSAKLGWSLGVAVVLAVSATACGSSSPRSSAGSTSANRTYTDVSQLEAAAKKEGKLNLYVAPEYQPFLTKGFKAAYPWVNMVVTPVEPPQAQAKFQAELDAGVHQADVVGLKEPALAGFVAKGAIAKVSVPNDSLVNASLKDAAGMTHPMTATETALIYNTKLVSAGPKDLADLAQPDWKGKLAVDDPLGGSTGAQVFASERKVLGDASWQQWLSGIKANKPSLTDSGSTSFESVLRGDRAICVCDAHDFSDAKPGSPLGIDFYNQDAGGIVVTPTIAVVAAKAPHPAMAALFLNWVESPTGGQQGFIDSGRSPVVEVPGAKSVVPSSVKIAPLFASLGDYYADPDSYNSVFKKYFN